jgi:hypothetical protein
MWFEKERGCCSADNAKRIIEYGKATFWCNLHFERLPHFQDFGSKVELEEPQKILLAVWNKKNNWLRIPFKKMARTPSGVNFPRNES